VLATQLESILRLHRHGKGYITLSSGSGKDFHQVIAIRRDRLSTYFSHYFEKGSKDSYVTINAGYRLAHRGKHGLAYGHPKHDSESLAYLCACYADLDHYNVGIDASTALAFVSKYQH